MNSCTNPSYRSGIVAIIGSPNVGKSTLLNYVLGEPIAAVSSKPHTTRNRILGVGHLPAGQMVFLDTPGLHRSSTSFNKRIVQTALSALHEADVILLVVTPEVRPSSDHFSFEAVRSLACPKILGVNKIDLMSKARLIPVLASCDTSYGKDFSIVPFSGLTGENVSELLRVLLMHLPEGRPLFPEDTLTDQPVRFLAAEYIRERAFHEMEEEIPYAICVKVDRFEETDSLVSIHATLYVEKVSQRKMLIGRNGQTLKKIGTQARLRIETLLGVKVFLSLWVEVKKEWRRNNLFLSEMGL